MRIQQDIQTFNKQEQKMYQSEGKKGEVLPVLNYVIKHSAMKA
jgi:hypothetical protein